MMNQKPLVSVLMPVYNAEKYVAEAIESILAQTFSNFEFIITDDGSTDQSLNILQQYVVKDKRIRLISRENRGLIRTLNEMIDQANGVFIARMDADDVALPERFARQVEFLQAHPEVVCVGSAHALIDEAGRCLLAALTMPEYDEEIQCQALAGHTTISHPCAMIRRDALVEVGGYDETLLLVEDLDLWLRLGERGKLANLRDVLLKYRINTQSMSGSNPVRQREMGKIACERAWKRRGIEGRFEATEPWRPEANRFSQHHFTIKYGWWAFKSSQRRTAMIYALRAIRLRPLVLSGWKLLICAIFKSPTAQNLSRKKLLPSRLFHKTGRY